MATTRPRINSPVLPLGATYGSKSQANDGSSVAGSGGALAGHDVLVECLAGPDLEPTVLIDGEGPRRFHRLFRAFRGAGVAHIAPESLDMGLSLLARAVLEKTRCHGDLSSRQGLIPGTCIPIVGPAGVIHAVWMAVGGAEPAGEVPVVPLEFDASFIARFGEPHGAMPTLFRSDTTWTLPAVLERVVWIDKRLDLIALFDPNDPAARWCGSLVIDDADTTSRRHLWMAVRSTADFHGQRVVRGVIADITAIVAAPDRDPLTEYLSARIPRGHGSALMDLRTTLMHSFSCCEDPRMTLWRHRNPQIHPADTLGLLQVLADLAANRPAQLTLRIRFADEEPWTTLHATCTPLANYSRPQANIDFWLEPNN
ncbi:hypothetical protein ACWCW7_29820 [Nocardia tengchongensis]